jgi:phenylalanyl-tRNA synthetase beta chain
MPILRRADRLRRSLVPSLLGARETNESLANSPIELFEIAHVYLPRADELPREELMVTLTSGQDFFAVKGVIEGLLAALGSPAELVVRATRQRLLDWQRSAELLVRSGDGRELPLGYLGEVSELGLKEFDLRAATTVAELKIDTLSEIANLIPRYSQPPVFPAVTRDLNLVVDESVRWADVAQPVRAAAASFAESLEFQDVYRDPDRLGAGKKSLLFTLTLRLDDRTLTGEEADQAVARVVDAAQKAHGAQLRA